MLLRKKNQTRFARPVREAGFTIVELLIVIVVIGILAALVLNTFSGAQKKARDVKRTDDVAKIKKALEAYKVVNGQYPIATASPGAGGWELSTDTPGTFLETLENAGFFGEAPLDPLNDATHRYWYYRYPPGFNSCPVAQGGFYVLRVDSYEDAANKPTGNSFSCSGGSQSDSAGTFYLYTRPEND